MRIIRGLHNIRAEDRGVAVTIGNFDGVHFGHRMLLDQLRRNAPNLRTCAICFEPQPLEYLRPELAPVRLQPLHEKLRCLQDLGVDQVLILQFCSRLAGQAPEEFVREVLIDGLAARHVLVGDDYRFGHKRSGDLALLKALADEGEYVVDQLATVEQADERVSSTRIRQALQAGDLPAVYKCLGRNFRLRGRVVHGQKLGRALGAPTANVALRLPSPLRHGVYCVRADGQPAVANIGLRPTVGGHGEHLEVHLLSGQHELYEQMLVVEFEKFLRPEQKFEGLPQLKAAIAADIQAAVQHFEQDGA